MKKTKKKKKVVKVPRKHDLECAMCAACAEGMKTGWIGKFKKNGGTNGH